jgi:hypothetical protein
MSDNECTSAPSAPSHGPSDWSNVVRGNCFSNLQRLGCWTGGANTLVQSGEDPSSYFDTVAAGSLSGTTAPQAIYVVVHGWAPGYQTTVDNAEGNLLWWGTGASAPNSNGMNVWASDWAWSPVIASTFLYGNITVNATGMLQSIMAADPNAVALAWSWIDESATPGGDFNATDVYSSEAYTHINGIRLANALMEAIGSSPATAVPIKLIGHSHGSKVATVAALTLQNLGVPVAQLTVLDSPESSLPQDFNGANLLGFYLGQMTIEAPSATGGSGTFVDNYTSCFGVGYAGDASLNNVVEVALDAGHLYIDWSYQHTYAAAWYGGAAVGAAANGDPSVGLAWPPPPADNQPALNQTWPGADIWKLDVGDQWSLQAGDTINANGTDTYALATLTVSKTSIQGNVSVNSSNALVFTPTPGASPSYSIYQGTYKPQEEYGITFDLDWTAPQGGDYLVVVIGNPNLASSDYYTLLVMDGQSACEGLTSVAINTHVLASSSNIQIYFLGNTANSSSQVIISNFQEVLLTNATSAAAADLNTRRYGINGRKPRQSQ